MPDVTITIDGDLLPSSWDGSDVVGLDGLRITWGRDDLYAQQEAAKLRLSVIDPTGLWGSDPKRFGARIIVSDQTDRVVYRGDVDQVTQTEVTIRTPEGESVQVWETVLSAVDPTAALAKVIPKGPGPKPTDILKTRVADLQFYGPNHWRWGWHDTRVQDVMAVPEVSRLFSGGIQQGWSGADIQVAPERMGASALDLIRRQYLLPGIGHVSYRPDLDQLTRGKLQEAGALRLAYTGGKVVIQSAAASVNVMPAGLFELGSTPTLVHTFSKAIDRVQLDVADQDLSPMDSSSYGGLPGETAWRRDYQATREYTVPGASGRLENVLRLDVGFIYYLQGTPGQWTPVLDNFFMAETTLPMIQRLNGKVGLPPLSIDLTRPEVAAQVTESQRHFLMSTYARERSVYFAGLRYAGIPQVGPQFQLIGATLVYEGGWRLEDMKWAPAVPAPSVDPVTIASAITNVNPAFQDIDPSISFADLANVSTGAA